MNRRVVDDMTSRAPLKIDWFGAKAALEVMTREPIEAIRAVFIIVVLGSACTRVGRSATKTKEHSAGQAEHKTKARSKKEGKKRGNMGNGGR